MTGSFATSRWLSCDPALGDYMEKTNVWGAAIDEKQMGIDYYEK